MGFALLLRIPQPPPTPTPLRMARMAGRARKGKGRRLTVVSGPFPCGFPNSTHLQLSLSPSPPAHFGKPASVQVVPLRTARSASHSLSSNRNVLIWLAQPGPVSTHVPLRFPTTAVPLPPFPSHPAPLTTHLRLTPGGPILTTHPAFSLSSLPLYIPLRWLL